MPTFPSTGPATGTSSTTSLLNLIPDAQGHTFMGGPLGFYAGTVASGTDATNIIDSTLIDSSGAQSWKGSSFYCYDGVAIGQKRFVQTVNLATGTLILNRALTSTPVSGNHYWLMRDYSRDQWAAFANQALREMRRKMTYLQNTGVTGRRIAVPSGINPDDVIDIRRRAINDSTSPGNDTLPWYAFDYVSGNAVLRTDSEQDGYELLWDVEETYTASTETVFATDSETTDAPRDWLTAEMVSLALATLWSTQVTDADQRRMEKRLGAAGRLVAGLRAKYTPGSGKRLISSDPM